MADRLLASRGDAPAPVFGSVLRPGQPLTERAVNYMIKAAAERAEVNPAVSVHWLRHAHAQRHRERGADHPRTSLRFWSCAPSSFASILRSEQLRIHLRAVPMESAEARRANCDLALMKAKSAALKLFGQDTERLGKILH